MVVLLPLLVVVVLSVGVSIGIRRAGDDLTTWHVDPLQSSTPSTPNWYRLVPADAQVDRDPKRDGEPPVFAVDVATLSSAFHRVATGEDRVEVLAGSASDGFVTYVQRSALFGFPDYISVRFVDLAENGSTLAIFSRARYGRSDMGVNEKRVARWIDGTTKTIG